jgi:hypothetical protein
MEERVHRGGTECSDEAAHELGTSSPDHAGKDAERCGWKRGHDPVCNEVPMSDVSPPRSPETAATSVSTTDKAVQRHIAGGRALLGLSRRTG